MTDSLMCAMRKTGKDVERICGDNILLQSKLEYVKWDKNMECAHFYSPCGCRKGANYLGQHDCREKENLK